jgi:cytochrome c biogenesis protein CcmG/thiol:disulfide interchange protein DsbE
MTRRLKLTAQIGAVALVAALLAVLGWRLAHSGTKVAKGPAPRFTLPRLDGRGDVQLASLRGKAVVLNFWASWCIPCKQEAPEVERVWQRFRSQGVVINFWASWCIPCKKEAKALEQAWRRHRAGGLVVLGVDEEDFVHDARKFADRHGMTYPLVHDAPGKLKRAYSLTGYPETFFVNRRGELVAKYIVGPVNHGDNVKHFAAGIELALK